jgi:hypothetical protein
VVSDAGQSLLVGRLSADRELARRAAFALFVRAFAEAAGMVPPAMGMGVGEGPRVEDLPGLVAEVAAVNPHVVAPFVDPQRRAALAGLDAPAVRELIGWLRAQRVHQEEPQVAYELGLLALGVELPAILVRGLRQATVPATARVAELPDGAGYATVFLATLHPEWRAAGNVRLFVSEEDAEQLAGWAMLLLSRTLAPPAGSIVRVPAGAALPLSSERFDLALIYHPAPWLDGPDAVRRAVLATDYVLV